MALSVAVMTTVILMVPMPAALAQGSLSDTYSGDDLVESGREFFGSASQGLASVVERAVGQFGLPNGYILGEDAGGALFAGARYGELAMEVRRYVGNAVAQAGA